MTVKELIEKLQELDPETRVMTDGYEEAIATRASQKSVRLHSTYRTHKEPTMPSGKMVKPIVLATFDRDVVELDDIDDMVNSLSKQLDGYIVLFALGSQFSVKVLSPKKMRRADYQACVNAAKKILSDVPR